MPKHSRPVPPLCTPQNACPTLFCRDGMVLYRVIVYRLLRVVRLRMWSLRMDGRDVTSTSLRWRQGHLHCLILAVSCVQMGNN